MYKVSSHSNHLFVKAARPRGFPVVGTTASAESPARRNNRDDQNRNGCPDSSPESMTSPKLVFKKSPSKQNYENGQSAQLSQNHEEMLRFVNSSWQQVMQEYELAREQGNDKVIYHTVSPDNNILSDFKPLDLEQWFVNRLLKTIDIDPNIAA